MSLELLAKKFKEISKIFDEMAADAEEAEEEEEEEEEEPEPVKKAVKKPVKKAQAEEPDEEEEEEEAEEEEEEEEPPKKAVKKPVKKAKATTADEEEEAEEAEEEEEEETEDDNDLQSLAATLLELKGGPTKFQKILAKFKLKTLASATAKQVPLIEAELTKAIG